MSYFIRNFLFCIGVAFFPGCGASQGRSVEQPEQQEAEDISDLVAGLEEMCRLVTEASGDMSGAIVFRIEESLNRFHSSPHYAVLRRYGPNEETASDVEGPEHIHLSFYDDLIAYAEERGATNFRCERFEWFQRTGLMGRENSALARADEASRAPVVDDLELLCEIAVDLADVESIGEVQIISYYVREVHSLITNELLFETVMDITHIAPDERLRWMNEHLTRIAHQEGTEWNCPAFDVVHRDYTSGSRNHSVP